ncbi:MAG: hypothetical protein ACYC2K_14015 [Gemmatimonadales bacterium]
MISLPRWLIATGLATTLTASAHAQARMEFTPFIGAFVPTSDLASFPISGSVTARGKLTTAPAFGARFSVVGQSGIGVEAAYFYSSSKLELSTGPLSQSIEGHVEGGSLKLVFQPRQTGSIGFALSGGAVGVKHAGTVFDVLSDQFDIGGVLGAGLRIPLTPGMMMRIDGEGFLYSWTAGDPFDSASQTTLMLSAGLAIRL